MGIQVNYYPVCLIYSSFYFARNKKICHNVLLFYLFQKTGRFYIIIRPNTTALFTLFLRNHHYIIICNILKGAEKMDKSTKNNRIGRDAADHLSKIKSSIYNKDRRIDKKTLICDIILFATGFVLSRCHLFFGARPVGLAFVAMLPTGVWSALAGAVISGFSSGTDGIIFSAACAIIALLRAAVSSGDRDESGRRLLFKEALLTRMAIALLGGFIVAAYEVLTSGLSETTMLFSLAMILITPLITFGLSGIFSSGITLDMLLYGSADILTLSGVERNEKYNRIFFQFSAILLIFLIGLSFKGVSIIGISASYIFAATAALLVAKRFGGIRGAATGFFASLSLSGPLSVSFALMGLGAGIMFSFGTGYAIVIGGIILSAWSVYTDGMLGLLSTLPEYAIASAIAAPICAKLSAPSEATEEVNEREKSEDMVGTMALSFQSKYIGAVEALPTALVKMNATVADHTHYSAKLSHNEYRDIVISVAERNCIGCLGGSLCAKEGIRPCISRANGIAELLANGDKIAATDVNTDTEFCQRAEIVAEEINALVTQRERERYLLSDSSRSCDEYSIISSLIDQAIQEDNREREVDNQLTDALKEALKKNGFVGGTIRAFGKRRKHFILAGEDEDGAKISSFELRKSIEQAAGVRLSTPEYFRRGNMMLMECDIRPRYKVSYATAQRPGSESEVSGDSTVCHRSSKDYFYSVICDGMGSGKAAKDTSELACEFIRSATEIGSIGEPIIHMLNRALREREDEYSATLDLFELDLLNGKGLFIKSGASPSYVKREKSIFRVKSQTAPLGLLKSVDTEIIRLEISGGDHIIMLSDGVADAAEDAPWLLLLLGEPPLDNLQQYADKILTEAARNSRTKDDMTVMVIRIDED